MVELLSRDPSDAIERMKNLQSDNTASGWFKTACSLASNGKMVEAERAMKIALSIEDHYPIAWAILAAILLSLGRETEAEQSGKKAIEQCKKLKVSWPKLRSLIISGAIRRSQGLKNHKRVIIDTIPNNEWGNVLEVLSETSGHDIDYITTSEADLEKQDDTISEGEKSDSKSASEFISSHSKEPEDLAPSKRDQTRSETIQSPSTLRPRDTSSARTWFAAAESHLKKRNYDEAERALRKALEFNPQDYDGWFRLGSLLFKEKNYVEAEKALRMAVSQIPGKENVWYLFGVSLQKLERWEEAIVPLKNSIKFNEENEDYWMKLGLSQYHIGQYKEAARCFLRTLRIAPRHRDATFYLAQCMEIQGNKNHAFSLYNELLKSGETRPEVLEKMAKAFDRLGAADRAREARRRIAHY